MAIKYRLYLEFSGRNQGWTDITRDLHQPSGLDANYGINGIDPRDRVASTGVLTCNLINSNQNSAGLQGYYTIEHTNQRTDFKVGIGIQLRLVIGATELEVWTGEITHIKPTPGIRLQRLTRITAVDYMDKCARTRLTGLVEFTNYALQTNKFDNAAWTKVRSTIDPDDALDPNLNIVADAIIASVDNNTHGVTQGFTGRTADVNHVWYVYAKAGAHDWVYIEAASTSGNGANVYFDLTVDAGAEGASVSMGTGTLVGTKLVDAGNGWYKGILIVKAGSGETAWTNKVFIAEADGDHSFTGDASSDSLYLCRAQFEEADFASSWIETEATAVTRNKGLDIARNVREQDAFDLVADLLPVQPRARATGAGFDTYDFVFDVSRDERDKVLTEFQRLALSGMSSIYTQGDGTLVYEPRTIRATPSSAVINITEADLRNSSPADVDDRTIELLNKVSTVVAPRREESAAVIMYELSQPQAFGVGGPFQVKGLFTDPAQRAVRAGGLDMLPAEANTDYVFNTAADGSGSDVTASVSVSTTFTGNAVLFGIINNSGDSAYATKLQARGTGVYAVEPATLFAEDDDLIAQWGENPLELEMPYQSDIVVAQEVADWLLFIHSTARKTIDSLPLFLDPTDEERALLIAQRGISDRITVTETMTGLTLSSFFINALNFRMTTEGHCWVNWAPAPSDGTVFWHLEIVGFSELDQTTRLGFGYVVGHTDVDHSDSHNDVAHGDVTHVDTHGDTHTDEIHGDTAHTDEYSDVTHQDSHTDTAYSDVAHTDVVHADSHSDVPYSDVAHADVPAQSTHGDVVHTDTHDDTAYVDVAHVDTAYVDVAHTDEAYQDVAHVDSHGDTIHDDVPHVDTPLHVDGENVVEHGDEAYSDVPHDDTYTDTHTDVPHDDTHTDTPHGDTHTDIPHDDDHVDTAHTDEHTDIAHSDSHTDDAHVDTHNDTTHEDSHTDEPHADSHTDVMHSDTHGDDGHSDAAHGDVAHVDTYSDTSHSDTAYIDEHGDTEHGDAN